MVSKLDEIRGKLFVDFISKFFKDFPNITALDIGCRYGWFTIEMAKVIKKVIAIDIYDPAIRYVKNKAKNFKNIEIYKKDFFNTNFKANSFDLIILEGVLEWIGISNSNSHPKEVQIQALKECKRILKDGGILFCGIENKLFPLYWFRDPHSFIPLMVLLPRYFSKRLYARYNENEYYGQNILSYWGYGNMFYSVFKNYCINIPIPNYKFLYFISPFNSKVLRSKAKKALRLRYLKKMHKFTIKLLVILSVFYLTKMVNNFIIICKKVN